MNRIRRSEYKRSSRMLKEKTATRKDQETQKWKGQRQGGMIWMG